MLMFYSLLKFIKNQGKPIEMSLALHIMKGIALGMKYLHTLTPEKVFHRDLKSPNILVMIVHCCTKTISSWMKALILRYVILH